LPDDLGFGGWGERCKGDLFFHLDDGAE
jgi:hypothetical protein